MSLIDLYKTQTPGPLGVARRAVALVQAAVIVLRRVDGLVPG